MFVGFVILLIVAYELPVIGPLMAISGIATWFLVPVFKVTKYLGTDPELHRKRGRALAFSLGVLAAIVIVIGIIKFPVNIDAEGVLSVNPSFARQLYVQQAGFVKELGKNPDGTTIRDGDHVHAGQVLMVLENDPLKTELAVKSAEVEQVRAQRDAATVNPSERLSRAKQLEELIKRRDILQKEVDKLVIKAPFDGELIAPDLQYTMGRYFQPSKHELCRVVDKNHQYVEAALPQDDYQLLHQQNPWIQDHTEVRMVGEIPKIVKALSPR